MEESATIYDALLPKEKKKDGPQRSMVEEVQAGAANGVKAKPKVAKKPNPREKKAVPITLEEAIKTVHTLRQLMVNSFNCWCKSLVRNYCSMLYHLNILLTSLTASLILINCILHH